MTDFKTGRRYGKKLAFKLSVLGILVLICLGLYVFLSAEGPQSTFRRHALWTLIVIILAGWSITWFLVRSNIMTHIWVSDRGILALDLSPDRIPWEAISDISRSYNENGEAIALLSFNTDTDFELDCAFGYADKANRGPHFNLTGFEHDPETVWDEIRSRFEQNRT